MSSVVIGVDAGGSTCVAARAGDGALERVVTHGPANPSSRGVAAAAATLIAAIDDALEGRRPGAIYVGAAGAGRAERAAALRDVVAQHYPGSAVKVGDDAGIALRAAIPAGPGAVVIAGTGSIAFADNGTATYRSGGLGYLLGDEGSALHLGLAALRWVARAHDGRAPHDAFTARVAQAFGATSPAGLIDAVYANPVDVERIAAVAPAVIELASNGDRPANKLVQAAALDLGELLKAVVRKAGMLEGSPRVALCGGLLARNSLLTYLLETRITGDIAGVEIVRSAAEPYTGALVLARELL